MFVRENTLTNTAGFPTKFVEALSCGVPVLTNFSSDLKKYMQNQKNSFLLDISSIDKLIDSLLVPLQLSKEERVTLKISCSESKNIFDYRNYLLDFNNFLSSIDTID